MDNSLDTSFIPQQPLLKVEGSSRRGEPLNVALVLGFIIFFVATATFGGMYVYDARVDKRVLDSEKLLEAKEADLKIDEIERYQQIDSRLSLAKKLLKEHTAFSTILTLLEEITAQNVGWTSLGYSTDPTDGSVKIILSGEAPSYSAVYAQAQAWRDMISTKPGTPLKKIDITMPTLNLATGVVAFGATLSIDPSYTKYANAMNEEEQTASPEITTESPTP